MAWREGVAVGVYSDVERLGVGTELMVLKEAPFITDCPETELLAALINFEHLGKGSLVIDIERDENELVIDKRGDGWVGPYGGFHLTAVDASVTGEVDEERLALGTSGLERDIVIAVFSLDGGLT